MPAVKPIPKVVRYRGDTAPLPRTLYDRDTGAVKALTGVTEIILTVRDYTEDATVMLERKYTDDEIRIVDAALGTFVVLWDADEMAGLVPSERGYDYDIEVTFPGDEVGDDDQIQTTEKGRFVVKADVTRPAV